ncbi:MAG: hypothetical protein AAGF25_09210 [Pseudomonadota bacterium]
MIEMSPQVQALIAKAETKTEFDREIAGDLNLATQFIYRFNEQIEKDQLGGKTIPKEDRSLRHLIIQIEEQIEVLARQRADDIVTRKSITKASSEGSDVRSLNASSGPASAPS